MKNVRFFPLCQHVNKQLCSCIIITALTIVSSPLQANTFLLESVRETEVLNSVTQQKVKVTGRVVDSTGEPLPGAAVVIQGTPQGVTTDMDGNFSMEVDLNAKLEISYLGMEKEVLTAFLYLHVLHRLAIPFHRQILQAGRHVLPSDVQSRLHCGAPF